MKRIKDIFNYKVRTVALFLLFIGLIGFTEISDNKVICKAVTVEIRENVDNHFLDEEEVMRLAAAKGTRFLEGEALESIDLKTIENDLEANPFIANGEIFKGLDGQLKIMVTLRRPVARIYRESAQGGYITENGFVMPLSDRFVARTLLITGQGADALMKPGYFETEEGIEMLNLINFVNANVFWKAQLAEMEVKKNGKVVFYPQVTRQRIEFGYPKDIEEKFEKLQVFYKQVLPVKGWNTYEKVNVEFNGQIVAE